MMSGRGSSAWHAEVLRDEAERLAIACRQLEHRLGWFEGRGSVQRVVEVEVLPTLRRGEVRRVVDVR